MTVRLDDEQIERLLAERHADAEEQRRRALEPHVLRWLALLPEWTDALARACEFPVGPASLVATLERAEAVGLCEVRHSERLDAREQIRFWVPAGVRRELFHEWRRRGAVPVEEARELARRVLAAPSEALDDTSNGVLRWAKLALAELSAKVPTGDELTLQVTRSLQDGKIGAAGEWVSAGESLGELLGGEMERAAVRARWQLRRQYRAAQDADYMDEFIVREEQLAELRRLFGEGPEWAVHFIGQSGVGKTMLMRYLTGLPATGGGDARVEVGAVARIDFDYVDPHFPLDSPARLLSELAADLAGEIEEAEQEACYLAFDDTVTAYEAASRTLGDPLSDLRSPRFRRVVSAFASFVESLRPPALFILDTCEELAKLHPPGGDMPSIEAMFEILEQVHEAVPATRVVLAGRRWLTPEAANELRDEATPAAVLGMKPRTFMRMHSVSGFTREEAERYLRRVRPVQIGDEMVEAVLRNTRDRGRTASMGEEEPEEEERYSPNDIALYARWIESDEGLAPSDLSGGNFDVYVEVRIFRRLELPEVRAAIPAAVLLERFDSATIAPALEGGPGAARRALDGLIEQEWTHLEGGPGPEEIVLSVDRGLLPRLLDYFKSSPERSEQLERARRRLVPHMAALLQAPCPEVAPSQIDTALKLLQPGDAVSLWDALAARVESEGEWAWAEAVCALLLSPKREPPLPAELLASVTALYVGALSHRRAAGELSSLRRSIMLEAPAHPDGRVARALDTRARLGMLREVVAEGGFVIARVRATLTRGRLMLGSPAIAPAIAPALLAAVEALVDAKEEAECEIPDDNVAACLLTVRRVLCRDGEGLLYGHLLALEGRLSALRGDRDEARRAFDRLAEMPLAEETEPRFTDWVPPVSTRHRVLLELLRFRLAGGSETGSLLRRCEEAALEANGGVDAARLLSLALQARLARGDLSERRVRLAELFERQVGSYEAIAPAQRAAPPLFVSVAECRLALGRPRRALNLLLAREHEITSRRDDEAATRAAALATIRALRRQRLGERFALISSLSLSEQAEVRAEAMAAGALIAGLPPPRGRASAADHAAWRARCLLDPARGGEAIEAIRKAKPGSGEDPVRLHRALDRVEAAFVWRRSTRRGRRDLAGARRDAERLSRGDAGELALGEPLGEERLRLALRRMALIGSREDPGEPGPTRRPRQLGQLALEEGELLALRLPERSEVLFDTAHRLLEASGDLPGAFAAALRGAIAAVHAGYTDRARAMEPTVRTAYERLAEADRQLPSLGRLLRTRGLAENPETEAWEGWMRRLAAYLRWCEGARSERGTEALAEEPELALVPAVGAEGSEVASNISPLGPLVKALSLVAGISIAIGLLFLLVTHSAEFAGRAAAVVFVCGVGTGFVAGFLAALFEALSSRTSHARLSVDAFELSIVLSDREAEGHALIEGRLDPWARRRRARAVLWALRRLSPRSRWTATFPLDDDLIENGPPRALHEAIAPRAVGGFVPVRLSVTASLAWIGWERWLVGGLAGRDDMSAEQIPDVWRIRSRRLTALPEGFWHDTVSTVCSPVWRPFVDASAARRVRWAERPGLIPAGATIVIGRPAFTRAGWRLRLDEDLPDPRPEGEAEELRMHSMISPDLVAQEAPLAFVVGRPGGGGDTASDVWFANGLRGFANETFLAGARAVLSIPSLPAEQLSVAIFELTAEVGAWDRPPDGAMLCGLVTKVRTFVDEDRMLDVCLFAPR